MCMYVCVCVGVKEGGKGKLRKFLVDFSILLEFYLCVKLSFNFVSLKFIIIFIIFFIYFIFYCFFNCTRMQEEFCFANLVFGYVC